VVEQPKGWENIVMYGINSLPPQALTLLAVGVVMLMMAGIFAVRHWRGKQAGPEAGGSWIKRWSAHFMAEKGHFYSAVLTATGILQVVNIFISVTTMPEYATLGFRIKQIILIVIGVVYVAKVVQLVLSALWMLGTKPEPGPTPYSMDDPDLPRVTVQIAIRAEPFEVVRMTLDSALALRYPADRLEIQVIDN